MVVRMQERIAIEANHFIGNTIFAKVVTNKLSDQKHDLSVQLLSIRWANDSCEADYYHSWKDISQCACQFEHDDDNGQCHTHNTTGRLTRSDIYTPRPKITDDLPKSSSSPKESVCSRGDTRDIWFANSKQPDRWIRTVRYIVNLGVQFKLEIEPCTDT